jgi:FdrA protein
MIDPSLRNEHVAAVAEDAQVGVLLLDVVLGYGSHADPAGALAPALSEARAAARAAGRDIVVVGSVCGTEADPQGLTAQERTLAEAGVYLFPSNARAAAFSAAVVSAVGAATGAEA